MKIGNMRITSSMMKMMVVFGIGYISYTVPYVLLVPYLTELGYTSSQQGIFMAVAALFGMGSQVVFGYLCDKFRSVKKFVYLASILLAISTWVFYSVSNAPIFLQLGLGLVMYALFTNIQGLLDSWALETDEDCQSNYGMIRAFGAIGWIIGCPILSYVANQYGYQYLGMLFAVETVVAFVVDYFTPDAQKKQQSDKKTQEKVDMKQLLVNRRYVMLLAIFFLAFFCMQCEGFLVNQKITRMDLTTAASYTSFKLSYQAIFELPFFFLGGWVLKKFDVLKVTVLAIVFYFVRLSLDALAPTQVMLIAISTLQLVGFPLLSISSKAMFDQEIPDHLKSSGQQLAYSVYSIGSMMMGPLVGGFLMDSLSVNTSLWVAAGLILLPLGMCAIYAKSRKEG